MKKVLVSGLMLFSIISIGQTNKKIKIAGSPQAKKVIEIMKDKYPIDKKYGATYKDNVLTVMVESQQGVPIPVTYDLQEKVVDSIKISKAYIDCSKKYTDCGSPMDYIIHRIRISITYAAGKYKNQSSVRPVANSKGMVYIVSEKNELTVFEYIEAQNGYGNYLTNKAYFKTNLETGESSVITF
jgi:hypothetical protein